MEKPILLLDIDGTLNPTRADAPTQAWPADQWIESHATDIHGLTWRVRAARPVVRFFQRLHELNVVDMRWHTAWQRSASAYGTAVGMPKLPLQQSNPCGPSGRGPYWKLEALVALSGARVAWLDDEARPFGEVHVVRPSQSTGLTLPHLEQVATWLELDVDSLIT